MHAILVSMGTDGDIFPFVGLGIRLRERGHRVTLAANEHYQALAVRHGLDFRALISTEVMQRMLADPDFWHPLKSALVGVRVGAGLIPEQYELLADLARDRDAVLVSNVGVFAARLVQEKLSRPLATLLLQPAMIPSVAAPPVMPFGLSLPAGMPRPLGRLYWRLLDAAADLLVGRHLNRVRASLGLPAVRRVFQWWLSPELVLGMFPDWYGPPQADWPPQVRLAGFPLFDGGDGGGVPDDVLTFCKAGAPPVAVTLGTGMMHAAEHFRVVVNACRLLGARLLVLTKYARQLPAPLPPFVHHCAFAPFLQLLPHCAALVHHGGIGTVAKALATGTPQLVLPLAWDQPDNAVRVQRLGAGSWLKPAARDSARLARSLAGLLKPEARGRSRAIMRRFSGGDAFDIAAQSLEELAGRRGGA